MIPPTPTPFISIPGEFPHLDFSLPSLWGIAPDAIQIWNLFGIVATCLQGAIILVVVGFSSWMVYKFARQLINNGEAT